MNIKLEELKKMLVEKVEVISKNSDELSSDELNNMKDEIKGLSNKIKEYNESNYYEYKRNLAIINTASSIIKYVEFERKLKEA